MDAYLWLLPALLPAVGFFWANCPCCGCGDPCSNCSNDTPAHVQVTLAGYSGAAKNSTAGPVNCDCDILNGLFVLDQSTLDPCRWQLVSASGSCDRVFDMVKQDTTGVSRLRVSLVDTTTSNSVGALYSGPMAGNECMTDPVTFSSPIGSICTGSDAATFEASPEC